MKALTVRQPWAQLLVTAAPTTTTAEFVQFGTRRTVKWIETRTRRAPASAIGQRIAITASAYRPKVGRYAGGFVMAAMDRGEDRAVSRCYVGPTDAHGPVGSGCTPMMLPLGVVVGSGVLTASVPMHDTCTDPIPDDLMYVTIDGRALFRQQTIGDPSIASNVLTTDCTDQLPFGDFSPGRWAWLFDDLAPITERCPACWGDGGDALSTRDPDPESSFYGQPTEPCPVCDGAGRCAPVPVKGRLGVWEWTL